MVVDVVGMAGVTLWATSWVSCWPVFVAMAVGMGATMGLVFSRPFLLCPYDILCSLAAGHHFITGIKVSLLHPKTRLEL